MNFNPAGVAVNLTSAGGEDVFISKLNSSGDNIWAISLGSICRPKDMLLL
ncbi:MAG: hypothetical protein R2822_15070 [Spirosomataceae bacterium]